MQTLGSNARHVAEWGRYRVIVDTRNDKVRAEVQKMFGDAVEETVFMAAEPNPTPAQAIEWASGYLEAQGCSAFVDGKRRRLADFFVFYPDGS